MRRKPLRLGFFTMRRGGVETGGRRTGLRDASVWGIIGPKNDDANAESTPTGDFAMSDCLFCRIVEGAIPAERVYEDEKVIAFKDINPVAPVHILVIPREHVATLNEADEENEALLGHLFVAAARIAKREGFEEDGYRCVVNCNRDALQTVFHVHLHLLAGRRMGWTPA